MRQHYLALLLLTATLSLTACSTKHVSQARDINSGHAPLSISGKTMRGTMTIYNAQALYEKNVLHTKFKDTFAENTWHAVPFNFNRDKGDVGGTYRYKKLSANKGVIYYTVVGGPYSGLKLRMNLYFSTREFGSFKSQYIEHEARQKGNFHLY